MQWFEMLWEWFCVWLSRECLRLADSMMDIFDVVIGISDASVTVTTSAGEPTTESVNLVSEILTNSTVDTIFWGIFVIGVALACIFAVVAIIQNMITGKKTLSGIIGKLCMSLLGTLAVFCAVMLGILICNELLSIVNDLFNGDGDLTLSQLILDACNGADYNDGYSVRSFVTIVNGERVYAEVSGEGGILGSMHQGVILPDYWQGNGIVDPNTFYYFECAIASVAIICFIVVAAIAMTRRLFELVYIYLVMPAAMSTLPFDDGARMKNWTEAMVSRFLSAYGTVISMNVYIILVQVLTGITVPGVGKFGNCVFTCLLLVGGAVCIPSGQNLFTRIFGSRDDYRPSYAPIRALTHTVTHAATAVVTTGASLTVAGAKAIGGAIEKNKNKQKGGTDDENTYRNEGGDDGINISSNEDGTYKG